MAHKDAEQLVKLGFEALNARDIETLERLVQPEFEFRSLIAASEGRTYVGPAGMGQFLEDIEEAFEDLRWEAVEAELVADDRVVVSYTIAGAGRASGIPMSQRLYAATWLRDGLMLLVDVCLSREEALEALGETRADG